MHNAEQLLGLDIHLFRAYSEGQISHGDWENFTQMQGDHELSYRTFAGYFLSYFAGLHSRIMDTGM